MLNRPSNGLITRVVVLVGALLAISAMLLLSTNSQAVVLAHGTDDPTHTTDFHDADPEMVHAHYAENGMEPVMTLSSMDPEGAVIDWDVTGVDAASFTLTNGVLRFKSSPDYEMPMDRDEDLTQQGDQMAGDRMYKITVRATEMRASGYTGPAKWNSTDVTVIVTNVDEDGMLELNRLLPEVDVTDAAGTPTMITATLMDPDTATGTDWEWYKSKVSSPDPNNIPNHWEDASNTARESATYAPAEGDVGRLLMVVATYGDMTSPSGTTDDKTARAVTANTVRAAVLPADNGSPDFRGGSSERDIPENAMVGATVGAMITAVEPDNDDILTYEIDNDATTGIDIPADHDANFFSIDKDTGQIRVAKRLDADAVGEGRTTGAEAGTYVFFVRATDPSGDDDQIEVTVTAGPVNEAPTVSGPGEATVMETPAYEDANPAFSLAYTVADPDTGDAANWTLAGDDAGAFSIGGTTGGRTITFKTAPDFEMPSDRNGDNVYKVTVVATDNGTATGEMMVSITVTNEAEDGEVTLAPGQPHLAVPVTASVEDPDGGVNVVEWMWERSDKSDFTAADVAVIAGATSATYMPTTSAGDAGRFLRVTAVYTDATSPADDPETDQTNESHRMATEETENAVFAAPGANMAPEFPAMSFTREVAELAPVGAAVGDPVTATDPDSEEPLGYTLGGSDRALFEVVAMSGQIRVIAETDLNYEQKRTYSLEVTATDVNNLETTVPVTVMVTDVDEAPMFDPDDNEAAPMYEENGTGPAETYLAPDPEGAGINWDVMGVDAGAFTIANGVLRFKKSPDFENPADDDDDGSNNTYNVTLMASEIRPAGYTGVAKSGTLPVIVTVEDVDEPGMAYINWLQPQAGTAIMSSLMDPDGSSADRDNPVLNIPNPEWFRSKVSGTPNPETEAHWEDAGGTGQNTQTYTPAAGTDPADPTDVGKFLMVEYSYTDGEGGSKNAKAVTAYRVRAAPDANGSPDFDGGSTDREVPENAMVGDNVGAAVTADEPDAADVVTYSLEEDNGNQGDDDFFSINKRTGQIMVAGSLDHEAGSADNDGEYVVTAMVTDPSGDTDMITVTITATDVNESPTLTGPETMMVIEDGTIDNTDADNHFTAMDLDERQSVNWSLSGEDAAVFQLSGTPTGRGMNFREKPDYEIPADTNGDNVYKVSIVATDNGASPQSGELPVRITVTNMGEDGELTLDKDQPNRNSPVEATLTDPDSIVHITSWQWERSPIGTETDYSDISGATGHIYTPISMDNGRYLRVTVMYRDGKSDEDDAAPGDPAGNRELTVTTANAVLGAPAQTNAPVFAQSSYRRMVAENTMNPGVVGAPVEATDPDGDDVTYSLDDSSGNFVLVMVDHDEMADTDMVGTAQIIVAAGIDDEPVDLNYEDQPAYTVELTADDGSGLKATTRVTIALVDMNETPTMPMELSADLVISGPPNRSYGENGTTAVGTYSAAGAHAASVMWSLSGDDMSAFDISAGGELTFMASPDYEMPVDANMNNIYELSVVGNDGTNDPESYDVIVTVSNVDEDGMVSLSPMTPTVGMEVTAMLEDPDGIVTIIGWEWSSSDMMDGTYTEITGATSDAYTPVEADDGMYLRATVNYDDGEGPDKVAYAMTAGAVPTMPVDMCLSALASLPSTTDGMWMSACVSEDRTGSYANYYTFTLDSDMRVAIYVTSALDTYLVLRDGDAKTGTFLYYNDDVLEGRNPNSRIEENLSAGTYTIEATTYGSGIMGDYTLDVREITCVRDLGALTETETIPGTLSSECESTQRTDQMRYARSYMFTLGADTDLKIDLTSALDTYLYVVRAGDRMVYENDDVVPGRNPNSQIDMTFEAGTYTVEATTYGPMIEGEFILNIGVMP